jgi:hypothetical protein
MKSITFEGGSEGGRAVADWLYENLSWQYALCEWTAGTLPGFEQLKVVCYAQMHHNEYTEFVLGPGDTITFDEETREVRVHEG